MFSNSSLLPALGNAFEHLRSLERVTLTLRCVHDENEIGSSLIAAIGSCKALKQLRLDLDTTMSSGGEMLAAVAQMLHELGPERRLQSLTLGYSWFSEASDETLHELQAAISVLPLHFVGLLAPQDPEMGSLENACSVLGRTVEEVLVMDGWDHDGLVFPVFLEALCQCPRLKRLHLIGEVPEKLDVESFEQTLRARVSGLPEVCVNCPLGIKIANHTTRRNQLAVQAMSAFLFDLQKKTEEVFQNYFALTQAASDNLAKEVEAVTKIQSVYRASKIRRSWHAVVGSTLLIQRAVRGWSGRRRSWILRFQRQRQFQAQFFHQAAVVMQRTFRGWWSRRHLHDFGGRKRYVQKLAKRGEWTTTYLDHEHQEKLAVAKMEEEERMRQEFCHVAGEIHHLVSTKSIPGIYNPPYNDHLPRAFDKPIECLGAA
ncbi:unnamed protein product [Cladocopium goreaui]|uniref:Spermatogenesis-associated protein 17 n=1 Tax=Cladocopium goreaui TaxID=2562237 RepID=A0A9P1G485_9DINO|nr:unnamed protein product [Cladocopium goreaui]